MMDIDLMRRISQFATLAGIVGMAPHMAAAQGTAPMSAAPPATSLKKPSDFSAIADSQARSAALFLEAGKVIESPRCMNCHPVGRSPTQGNDLHLHVPFIDAGEQGHGGRGLFCTTCHQTKNVNTQGAAPASIPGHPHWGLAPPTMSWQGKSLAEVCQQIKDPARNGGRTLAQIQEHMARDSLVGWAWRPGEGREPAPATQAQFGALISAWIKTGAFCPS